MTIYRGEGGGGSSSNDSERASISVVTSALNALLSTWAATAAYRIVSATRNSDGAVTTASIAWPDGASGVFTADVLSTAFPGAIDAWHATYLGQVSKTITQSTVTRDSDGAITSQPALNIV